MMMVHYNQAHRPFLGDEELRDDGTKKTVWDLTRRGDIPIERIKKAYKENLRIVMKQVERLKEQLPGRVILTAAHGETLGEAGIVGHPPETHMPALVEVPYLD